VRTRDAAVMADVSVPGRTGTLIGFDVGESNWPLKASFVLFVRNVVELARAHQRAAASGPFRTGEALRVRVPDAVDTVELERPNGDRETLKTRAGSLLVPAVHDAGFYFVSWRGDRPGSALLAANLTSAAESDVRERPLPDALQGSPAAAGRGLADVVTGWSWLLGAVVLLLIGLDVYWLTRRPRLATPGSGRPRPPERRLPEGARA